MSTHGSVVNKARANAQSGRSLRAWISTVILLAASAVVYFTLSPLPPRLDRRPHQALGRVLAEEALRLREANSRIVVITRDTQEFKMPASTAALDSLRGTLKKAGVAISTVHSLKVDPLRVVGVPPGDFFELLRKSSDNDVIISLLGPPALGAEQLAKLGNKRPHVIAVCSGSMPQQIDLAKLFEQKLLQVAVVSRLDAGRSTSGAGSAQTEFERLYKLITPANQSELAASIAEGRP